MSATTAVVRSSEARPAKPNIYSALLALTMLATGASGLVAEYILATVSSYVLGGTIEQFSLIIATMLAMMGLASVLQSKISSDHLIEKFVTIEVLLTACVATAPIAIYATYGLAPQWFSVVQMGYVICIGFLIGLEIPIIARVNESYASALKVNLAWIFGADYIGAFVGALVWVKFLLPHLPLVQISFIMAGINLLVAMVTYGLFLQRGIVKPRLWLAAAVCVVTGFLIFGYSSVNAWTIRLEQRLYEDPVAFTATTKYQHLVLTHDRAVDNYILYINGSTQFSSIDEEIYHESLVHPVMHLAPNHARVLILGGGDGMALREVRKYDTVSQIVLVDIDPEMVRLFSEEPELTALNGNAYKDARISTVIPAGITDTGKRWVALPTGKTDSQGQPVKVEVAEVDVFTVDAGKFLDNCKDPFDVVIVDLPDPDSVELCRLYSKEFYMRLAQRIAPEGMVAIQATSPYHAKEAFLCIKRTLGAAGWETLPYHDNVPSFGDWGWLLAWRPGTSEAEIRARIEALERWEIETSYLTPERLRADLVFGKGGLRSTHGDTINTLMRPALLDIYLHESWKIE